MFSPPSHEPFHESAHKCKKFAAGPRFSPVPSYLTTVPRILRLWTARLIPQIAHWWLYTSSQAPFAPPSPAVMHLHAIKTWQKSMMSPCSSPSIAEERIYLKRSTSHAFSGERSCRNISPAQPSRTSHRLSDPVMPDHTELSLRFDRPPSPSDKPIIPTSSRHAQLAQSNGESHTEGKSVSPALPANPPPTPETPSIMRSSKPTSISTQRVSASEFPPSPPPSPPLDDGSMSRSSSFCFLETFMSSKRQAASVHGKCSCFMQVARADDLRRDVDAADHLRFPR